MESTNGLDANLGTDLGLGNNTTINIPAELIEFQLALMGTAITQVTTGASGDITAITLYSVVELDFGGGVTVSPGSNIFMSTDGEPGSLAIGITNGGYASLPVAPGITFQATSLEYNNGQVTNLTGGLALFGVPFETGAQILQQEVLGDSLPTAEYVQAALNSNPTVLNALGGLANSFAPQ